MYGRLRNIEITPQVATAMLDKSGRKGRIKRAKVDKYKLTMLSGKWVEKRGMPIKFRGEDIIDGFHRLTAITECNVTLNLPILNL